MDAPAADGERPLVLFLCTHNSARSQLAEGLLRARHGDRYRAASAGTVARGVHPLAAEALREVGIDPSGHASKTLESLGDVAPDVVVTVCDAAREVCPVFPSGRHVMHRAFPDPSAVEGTGAERREAFRRVRDEIAAWLDETFGEGRIERVEGPLPAEARAVLDDARLPTDDLDTADVRFWVARAGGRVVGTAGVERLGRTGLLRSVAVASGARGRGLGRRLVAAAEAGARDEGLGALALLTTTAAPFFQARGYRPVERADLPAAVRASAEFVSLCPAGAACLMKRLG